ncbi:MAG TPA: hypothetical protein PK607_14315, partial [Aggregatilineales bacterium]|nr:hypothetical protein [Aggregatilineales bacterium]
SVVKDINEPRYPSFMGIRKASRAQIPTWSAEDIGVDPAVVSKVTWPEVRELPQREGECEMIEAATAAEAAALLVDRLVEEKVI